MDDPSLEIYLLTLFKNTQMNFQRITQILVILCLLLSFTNSNAQDEDVLFQAFDWNVQNQPAGTT